MSSGSAAADISAQTGYEGICLYTSALHYLSIDILAQSEFRLSLDCSKEIGDTGPSPWPILGRSAGAELGSA